VKSENKCLPVILHKVPLHDIKFGVLCAISENRIIGPIIFLRP
jgi:hypothetical protein